MKPRTGLNIIMTFLIIIAMSYRVTGDIAHEINGLILISLFVAHNIINRKKYSFRITLRNTLNLLILSAVLILVVNGVILSRTFFPFIDGGESMMPKRLHTFAAYWLFILVSMHIGLHSGKIFNKWKMGIGAVGIMAGGIYASFSRDVGSRLVMYYSFDFWDPNKPALGFILSNLAIMGLYIVSGYYGLKLIRKLDITAYRRPNE